ncbi:anti-sigma factor [Georgenia sp. SYP-B2076]|uniref:anti-sigma factor family protein n=1 Tax=Georgenia sp. SYP-B2076 TaxID=2495881 RepID=UPI000F8DD1D8|nr:zf-HC2 domain-containing protein [Georgenia sp. SYP-B2076]
MSHLGDDVSALVDGQLPPERAEEALAHLVTCEECAAEVANERAYRQRLSQAWDVAPSVELTNRLMRMAQEPALPPHGGHGPARGFSHGRARGFAHGRARRRLVARTSVAVAGAAGVVGALVVVGTLVERTGDPSAMLAQASGAGEGRTELVVSADTLGRDVSEGALSPRTTDAALAWLEANGWSAPAALPTDLHINHVGTVHTPEGEELLGMEMVGDGHQIRVVEQRGVLEAASVAALPTVDAGDFDLYELPGPGTAVVLQAHDVTVLVSSPAEDDLVLRVAETFPGTPPGSGVGDRLDRGWQTLLGWTDLIVQAP